MFNTYDGSNYKPDSIAEAFWVDFKKGCSDLDIQIYTVSEATANGITFEKAIKNNNNPRNRKRIIILPDSSPILLDTTRFSCTDVGCGQMMGKILAGYMTLGDKDGQLTPYTFQFSEYGGGYWKADEKMDAAARAMNAQVEVINTCMQYARWDKPLKRKDLKKATVAERPLWEKDNKEFDIWETLKNRMTKMGNGSIAAILTALKTSYVDTAIKIDGTDTMDKINLLNGYFDLSEMRFHKGDEARQIGFSRISPTMFDPQADSSMVTRFISDITSKDGVPRAEVFRYILQMFGSMLNSKRTLKKILVLWGPGTNNGKTTFLEAVKACLGSVQDNGLQGAIDPKNFDQFAQSQALTPEMCAAEKAKLITVSEAAKGIYLSCDKLKNMSGGGDISVNPKYKDSHTVVYHALIVMDCNNWPRFSDSSIFNSGRVKVIDFRWTPDHIDTGFKDKISTPENRSALLNLLISGYADFAANNYEYTEPKELQELTQSFANSNNLYRRFLVSRCAITGDNKDSIGLLQLVRSYKDWINEEGEYANNIAGCKDGLREELSVTKGIAVTTNNHNTTTVYGLRLKTPTELANSSYVNPEDIPEINRGEIEETKTPKLDEWIRFHINFKITSKASLLDIGAELEMDSKVETTDPYDASNRISTLAGNGSVFLNVGDDGDEFLTGVELVTDEVAKARRAEYIHDEVIPEIIRRTKGPYPDEVVELMFDVIKHSKDAKDEMVKVLTKYAEAHMEDYLDIKK